MYNNIKEITVIVITKDDNNFLFLFSFKIFVIRKKGYIFTKVKKNIIIQLIKYNLLYTIKIIPKKINKSKFNLSIAKKVTGLNIDNKQITNSYLFLGLS